MYVDPGTIYFLTYFAFSYSFSHLFILHALCSLRCWVVVINKVSLHLHGVYFLVRIEAAEPGIHNPNGGEEGWQGIVL